MQSISRAGDVSINTVAKLLRPCRHGPPPEPKRSSAGGPSWLRGVRYRSLYRVGGRRDRGDDWDLGGQIERRHLTAADRRSGPE